MIKSNVIKWVRYFMEDDIAKENHIYKLKRYKDVIK